MSNGLSRALLSLCAAIVCFLAFGASASADDGTTLPRAVPAARSLPRTFGSYTDLIAYASAVASDQTALDQRLGDVRAQLDGVVADLAALRPESMRGGALFDPDSTRAQRPPESALSVQAVTLWRTQQQLLAAGALTKEIAPWRMPTGGEITQPFGPTRLRVEPARVYDGVAYAHFHEGVDIAGDWAADVVAPARGRVVYVGRMLDGAEVVVIAHDGGLASMYAHLDAWQNPPTVVAGEEVAAGQKIGTVGMTGISYGMHLHWAVYRYGDLIDPMSLIGH